MKVAKKSPKTLVAKAPTRATLTLDIETYRRIDALRGGVTRAAWVQALIKKEQERLERERFIASVNAAYTPEVCRETLRINDEYPIHEG